MGAEVHMLTSLLLVDGRLPLRSVSEPPCEDVCLCVRGDAHARAVAAIGHEWELKQLLQQVSGEDLRVAAMRVPAWCHELVGTILGVGSVVLPREQVDLATMRGPQLDGDVLLYAAAQALLAQHQESLDVFWACSGHGLAQL